MRLTLSLSLLVVLSPFALAQTTQSEIAAKLVHQPMFLRGLWKSDSLWFDANGRLVGSSETTSPLLSSIDIEKVELTSGRLLLKGKRMALVYHGEDSGLFDPKENVKIEIDSPTNGDFEFPLGVIFAKALADLAPAAPDFWQSWMLHGYVKQDDHTHRIEDPKVAKIGGGVTPPRPKSTPEPHFTKLAREAIVSGSVLVYLQVEADGKPSHLRIVRPLGLGLDENAIEAVSRWKFEPAKEGGVPVRVEMNVDVNFQIF
jgi:TonB family protein